ncbi:hypothetical protein [uncultured Paenibacillus sp.]|uniref:hypothetical protein n=1 Tax=uncultured Paenibacillus sp. TaxID=227322 RepID=UPI0028D3CB82|nr:hypothetical protein [uncultured Paenibacillus sp.]
MKRSFRLSESASRAKEQRNMWSSEYQDIDVREEESVDELMLKEDLAINEEPVNTEPPSEAVPVNVPAETAKPRKARPVSKPNSAPKPKSVLRPKSTPVPTPQATAGPAAKRPPAGPAVKSDRPEPGHKPLKRKSPPFGERYARITTYLEKPLFRRVHDLHQRGEFAKIASLLNAAVREYLDRHYPS